MCNMLKRQFLPTLKDINNEKVKRLARRLKSSVSDGDTLINILEWQERNIKAWEDRWYMFLPLYILIILSFYFLPFDSILKPLFIILIVLIASFDISSVIYPILSLLGFLIIFFTVLFSIGFPVTSNFFSIYHLVALSIIFGSMISLIVYLSLKYRNLKSFQPDFRLADTFKLSLPVEKIIKYRLAICRDYAKLTSALLMNLFPTHEHYLALIPQHVAAGIKINNKIYILDQRLPVLTLEKWVMLWKEKLSKKKIKAEILKIIKKGNKIKTVKINIIKINETKIQKLNTKEIEKKTISNLKIQQTSLIGKPNLEIPLKNYAICYDQDRIVVSSLVRSIENKIKNEFCENLNKISRIELRQNKKDIVLKIWIK